MSKISTITTSNTTLIRKALEEERNRKIVELYLRAIYTQQQVAELTGVTQQTVDNVIKNTNDAHLRDFGKSFKPLLYNIWNTKQGNSTEHSG